MVESIKSEIFYYLLTGLIGHSTEDEILENNMPFYLRKLNCFLISVIKQDKGEYLDKYVVPHVYKHNEAWTKYRSILIKMSKDEDHKLIEFEDNGNFYYCFQLERYGLLILGRKKPFDNFFKNEFSPVVNLLAKSLVQTVAEELLIKSQEELSRERNLLKTIISNIPIHIYAKNKDNQTILQNNKIEGYEKQDIVERKNFSNEYLQKSNVEDQIILTNNKILLNKETEIISSEGQNCWALVSKIPLKDENNQVSGMVGITLDITAQKAIERSLLRKQKILEGIALATEELIKNTKLEKAIKKSLSVLGKTIDVDRTYLFKNSIVDNQVVTSQQYRWILKNKNSKKVIHSLQNIPWSTFDAFSKKMKKRSPFEIIVANVPQNSKAKEIFLQFGSKSILVVPIYFRKKFWGFIGLDDKKQERNWSKDELTVMKSFGSSFSSLLERIEVAKELKDMALFPLQNPNPIVRIDLDGNVILKNKAAEILKKITGTSLDPTINTEEKIYNVLVEKLDTKHNIEAFEIVCQNQTFLATSRLSLANKYINIHFSNITKHKEIETVILKTNKYLKFQEEKYRNMISNMNLGLLEIDNNNTIQFCNHSFTEMSGYSLQEIKGQKAFNQISLYAKNGEFQNYHAQSEISEGSYEFHTKNKFGEDRWWLISHAKNYNDIGDDIGSVSIYLDITNQKHLEEELEKALALSQKNSEAKELFLANMSHEIRTPLNGIIGMIRELNKEKQFNGKQKEYLQDAMKASRHLLSVVNSILDITKIEAGEFILDSYHFRLSDLLQDLGSMFKSQANEKSIGLDVELSKNIDNTYIGDAARIRQILINMIGNAIKFTAIGKVTIKCSKIKSTIVHDTLCFTIQDTGIGMTKDYLSNLFQKFQQEDESISRNFGGTGLGMVISKELVDLMGGEINVESEKGVGTTIQVLLNLPVGNEKKVEQRKIIENTRLLENSKVLLVEDNAMNRMVVRNSFKYWNINMIEAENGKEAIAILKNESFDLILMDINMPILNGIDATKIIRNELEITTPIIALSANAFKSVIDKCLAIGMNDYITKPFEEEDLYNVLTRNLKNTPIVKNSNKPDDRSNSATKAAPIPSADHETCTYNLTKLVEMSRGDEDFVKMMLELFIDIIPKSMIEMKQHLIDHDFENLRLVAHRIKPSLQNLGVDCIKQDVLAIENYENPAQNVSHLEELLTKVDIVLKNVVVELTEKLA